MISPDVGTAWHQHICMTSTSSIRCDWCMSDCTGLRTFRDMQVINRKRVLQPWWFSAFCLEGVPSPLLSISVHRFHENSCHSYPHCAFLFRNLSFFAMSARRGLALSTREWWWLEVENHMGRFVWIFKATGTWLKEGNIQPASFDANCNYKWKERIVERLQTVPLSTWRQLRSHSSRAHGSGVSESTAELTGSPQADRQRGAAAQRHSGHEVSLEHRFCYHRCSHSRGFIKRMLLFMFWLLLCWLDKSQTDLFFFFF